MSTITKICHKVITVSFYILFFLIPIILTPWNYELFEFNKMLLVYALTTIIVAAMLTMMITFKKFIFRRSFWDFPLLLFLFSQIFAYFFSIDRHTSFWGYYSRFNGGLASLICYLALYWAFVSFSALVANSSRHNNLDSKKSLSRQTDLLGEGNNDQLFLKNCLAALLISALLVSSYGILEHFGIDAQYWVQDVRNRVFSTLGQPNWLAAWLAALIPLTWSLAIKPAIGRERVDHRLNHFFYYLLFSLFYLCLLYTKSKSGLIGTIAAALFFWPAVFFLFRRRTDRLFKPFITFASLFIILTLLAGTPWTPKIADWRSAKTVPPEPAEEAPTGLLISESGNIRKVVWKGAIEIWKNYPLFGTGVETFAYSYYWYRPREHNDLSEWDFLYNKAHNEYLNYAATTGTVGLASYLFLILVFLFHGLKDLVKKRERQPATSSSLLSPGTLEESKITTAALLSGFISILVTNFFGFSVVPVSLLFFLYPAFAFVVSATDDKPIPLPTAGKIALHQKTAMVLIFLLALILLYSTSEYWRADTKFALAERFLKSDQPAEALDQIRQAVEIRPEEPVYHNHLGLAAADSAALNFLEKKETELVSSLAELAVSSSDRALKTSPYNLNFWKDRAKIGYRLAEIDNNYYQISLTAMLRASLLAPTDAKVFYNLGIIYTQTGQMDKAVAALEKAVNLKPNYETARFTLSLYYELQGEREKAKEQLRYILQKINARYQPAIEKLKTWGDYPPEAGRKEK